jgi:hypothetical protein
MSTWTVSEKCACLIVHAFWLLYLDVHVVKQNFGVKSRVSKTRLARSIGDMEMLFCSSCFDKLWTFTLLVLSLG